MTKAVFIASRGSIYDDRPGEVYHFPNRNYLSVVAQTVGDWVIFYEGRRGGGRGYYAVQKVQDIVPDPANGDMSYAVLDRGTWLSFEQNVLRSRPDGTPIERRLAGPDGQAMTGGANTSAVRTITDAEFSEIVALGLSPVADADTLPSLREPDRDPAFNYHFAEPAAAFETPFTARPFRPDVLTSRKFREASFARQVKRAYRGRCAMSGLELRNGGGRPEVEAAHILPVAEAGPDVVSNGIALSGTLHWMFDRGLVSVDSDRSLLVAAGSIADEVADRLFLPGRRLLVPDRPELQPHPAFLKWHRDHCFKG